MLVLLLYFRMRPIGVKSTNRDISLFPLQSIDYPYHISTVFGVVASSGSASKSNESYDEEHEMLRKLFFMDYRYSRFALDPRTGLFGMIRLVPCLISYRAMT